MWLWPFHLVWLSRFLLVRPLLQFSLSCPLLQLANQPNHCPLLSFCCHHHCLALVRCSSLAGISKSRPKSLWSHRENAGRLRGVKTRTACAPSVETGMTSGVYLVPILGEDFFVGNHFKFQSRTEKSQHIIPASCCIISI